MPEPSRASSSHQNSAIHSSHRSNPSSPTTISTNDNLPPTSHKRKRSSPTSTTKPNPTSPRQHSTSPAPSTSAPPLPSEPTPPPLPTEPLPGTTTDTSDDGWAPIWDATAQSYYFFNRFTQASQWENPRVPTASAIPPAPGTSTDRDGIPGVGSSTGAPGVGLKPAVTNPIFGSKPASTLDNEGLSILPAAAGGYNPAIHGSYDPNADYAQLNLPPSPPLPSSGPPPNTSADPTLAATAHFNRFTGRFQSAALAPENYNDEAKSKRQMNAYFDVDAAANSHDGRSLKAERAGKKLSKSEVKAFKEKRKERKEEKRRAWLRD